MKTSTIGLQQLLHEWDHVSALYLSRQSDQYPPLLRGSSPCPSKRPSFGLMPFYWRGISINIPLKQVKLFKSANFPQKCSPVVLGLLSNSTVGTISKCPSLIDQNVCPSKLCFSVGQYV